MKGIEVAVLCFVSVICVMFGNVGLHAILNTEWLLVRQPAQQNYIKQHRRLRYYILYKLFRVRVRVDFI